MYEKIAININLNREVENDKKENVVLVCLKDKHIVTYTAQKNNWIRINEYNAEGKMIGETYQYYTIKDNYIYVKCNPDDMIKSDLNDMGYFVSYYCLREDMAGYFHVNHIKFRIMAVLTSNNANVSPELVNFRITGR